MLGTQGSSGSEARPETLPESHPRPPLVDGYRRTGARRKKR